MSRYPTRWLVSLTVVALALAGVLWWVGSPDRSTATAPVVPVPAAAPAPSGFSSAAGVAVRSGSTVPTRSVEAVDVLHGWDVARSHAYAAGDVAGLRALYVPGSAAGTTDVALLRSYRRRGLRVDGMRMQVLAVEVLAQAPGRWRLRVTDRLSGAVAVDPSGTRLSLPRDEASTRVVTLRRDSPSHDWLVASVF